MCTVGFKGEYCDIGKYIICGTASLTAANNGELTQQDGRKKRTVKNLCVTNVTGLFNVRVLS